MLVQPRGPVSQHGCVMHCCPI
ncbi:hypothetical protein IEO21_07920 [Rhodonia placenta]|uniref:Uncharacterized protein n=1 Tax=Rhodonia placenta TaxID=104341 RepID=A0A8H7NXA5_9APHY|nr:hypothetical protein IEO21_07920 [Postia placenta]